VPVAVPVRGGATLAVKRAVDVFVAGTLLVVMLPVMVLVAVAVRVESPGPLFIRCERHGYRGRRLGMLKFRKMRDGARGLALTTCDDARLTRIGRFLASTKLDELPQLWHVLRGEMSLVGPRPEDRRFVAHHADHYRAITSVRPGMLGPSQLAFVDEASVLDPFDPIGHYETRILPQKVGIDRLYVERWSLGLDLRIALWSVLAVLLRQPVAVDRDTLALQRRRR
jgi:lipopolysaccharide/colanic/teichoic acid biosynthesis glycosyltransferase